MQRINVDSDVEATVTLDRCGRSSTVEATTPATLFVSRRATRCSIHLSAPGQEEQVVRLHRRLANIGDTVEAAGLLLEQAVTLEELGVAMIFTLPVVAASATVDFASGAVYVQEPSDIFVRFFDDEDEELDREDEIEPDD